MSIRMTTLALAATLLAAGCSQPDQGDPAVPVQAAQREDAIVATAKVENVNQQTREVTLRGADGKQVTVVAGPEVRNLPQLAVGDVVRLTYVESVAVRMAGAGEGGPATGAVVAGRAPEGAKPAGMLGAAVSTVVTFRSYDPATGIATFIGADNQERSIKVDPAMQEFAAARRPGDRVAIDMTNAVAVSIVETAR